MQTKATTMQNENVISDHTEAKMEIQIIKHQKLNTTSSSDDTHKSFIKVTWNGVTESTFITKGTMSLFEIATKHNSRATGLAR
jgi:hypothetical protein